MTRKAPAFQFYVDDFLGGTSHMTAEEVGVYVRLLCFQWHYVHLSERHVNACGGDKATRDFVLSEKFIKTDLGYQNKRLEEVRDLKNTRTKSASKGGTKTQAKRQANVEAKSVQTGVAKSKPPSPSPSPIPSSDPEPVPTPNPDCISLGHDTEQTTTTKAKANSNWRTEIVANRSPEFQAAWKKWQDYYRQVKHAISQIQAEEMLMALDRQYPNNDAKQTEVISFSIRVGAKNLLIEPEKRSANAGNSHQETTPHTSKSEQKEKRLFENDKQRI